MIRTYPAACDDAAVAGPLISVDELADSLDGLVVLDVRWRLGSEMGRDEYGEGHVPTARWVNLTTALAAPAGEGGRHPLPDPEVFARAMRDAGVSQGSRVVAYDDYNALPAARLWWLLRHHGHDDVRLLDGGWAAWRAADLPVETGFRSAPAAGDFQPVVPGRLRVLDAQQAGVLASSGVLLDVRDAVRFRGEQEPIDPVAGHIPGALNLPASGNLRPDGRFRDPGELRERLKSAGVSEDSEVGAYCGSGVTAAQQLLAMEVAGIPGAALYAGSWSDWITDPARPVATGE